MEFLFRLDPECPGEWGPETVVENQGRIGTGEETIPILSKLEAVFTVWFGDDLVDVDGILVTDRLGSAISAARLTGGDLRPVKITVREHFLEGLSRFLPGREFPTFQWLKTFGSVRYTSAGVVTSWSGDDLCLGVNTDHPHSLSLDFIGRVPERYGLVVSQRAYDLIRHYSLDHCDIIPMTLE